MYYVTNWLSDELIGFSFYMGDDICIGKLFILLFFHYFRKLNQVVVHKIKVIFFKDSFVRTSSKHYFIA